MSSESFAQETQKWRTSLFIQFFLTYIFIGYILAIYFPIVWQESDDISMKRIASGYFTGTPDVHLIFINACLGWVFKILYLFKPGTQWYSWFFVLSFAWVNSIFSFLFFRNRGIHFGIGIIGLLLVWNLFLLEFNLVYQFTILSSLIGLSGYLLFHFYFKEKQTSFHWKVVASVSVLLSFLIRKESFLLVSLFMFPFFAFEIKTRWKLYCYTAGPVLGLLIIFSVIHTLAYSSSEWQTYKDYNAIRPIIPDAASNDYAGLENDLKAVGWDTLDFRFRKQYLHECVPKFSNTNIAYINKVVQSKARNSWKANGFEQYWVSIFSVIAFLAFVALLVRKADAVLLLCAFFLTMLAIYFVAIQIRIPERVVAPIFFISIFFGLLLLAEKFKDFFDKVPGLFYTLIGIALINNILGFVLGHYRSTSLSLEIDVKHRKEFVEALSSAGVPGVIQTAPMARRVFNDYLVFEKDQTPDYLRILPNGWLNMSPVQSDFASHFNVSAHCRLDMTAYSPHAFQVDFQNNKVLERYLKKNYSSFRIDTVFVTSTGDYCAYRLVEK